MERPPALGPLGPLPRLTVPHMLPLSPPSPSPPSLLAALRSSPSWQNAEGSSLPVPACPGPPRQEPVDAGTQEVGGETLSPHPSPAPSAAARVLAAPGLQCGVFPSPRGRHHPLPTRNLRSRTQPASSSDLSGFQESLGRGWRARACSRACLQEQQARRHRALCPGTGQQPSLWATRFLLPRSSLSVHSWACLALPTCCPGGLWPR